VNIQAILVLSSPGYCDCPCPCWPEHNMTTLTSRSTSVRDWRSSSSTFARPGCGVVTMMGNAATLTVQYFWMGFMIGTGVVCASRLLLVSSSPSSCSPPSNNNTTTKEQQREQHTLTLLSRRVRKRGRECLDTVARYFCLSSNNSRDNNINDNINKSETSSDQGVVVEANDDDDDADNTSCGEHSNSNVNANAEIHHHDHELDHANINDTDDNDNAVSVFPSSPPPSLQPLTRKTLHRDTTPKFVNTASSRSSRSNSKATSKSKSNSTTNHNKSTLNTEQRNTAALVVPLPGALIPSLGNMGMPLFDGPSFTSSASLPNSPILRTSSVPPLALPLSENHNQSNINSKRYYNYEYRSRSRSRSDSLQSNGTAATTASVASVASASRQAPAPLPPPSNNNIKKNAQKRHVEILVHNVSHTDMVLSLSLLCPSPSPRSSASSSPAGDADGMPVNSSDNININNNTVYCRPRFSAFDLYCRRVLEALRLEEQHQKKQELSKSKNAVRDADDVTPRTAPGRQAQAQSQPQKSPPPDINHHGNSHKNQKPPLSPSRNTTKKPLPSQSRSQTTGTTPVNSNFNNSNIISFPLYERSYNTPRYSLVTPRPSDQKLVPAGMALHTQDASTAVDLDLTPLTTGSMNMDEDNHGSGGAQKTETTSSSSSSSVPQYQHQQNNKDHNSIANLRIRGKDKSILQRARNSGSVRHQQKQHCSHSNGNGSTKVEADADASSNHPTTGSTSCFLHGVYFPLLAPLIPLWLQRIHDKYNNYVDTNDDNDNAHAQVQVKKVVILVTGVGTPRNWTHSITGNSTELCATLMKLYLRKLYPDLTVFTIHSNTNLFRYDENILFAKEELMPCLESLRDAHARGEPYPDHENDEDEHEHEEEWHAQQQQNEDHDYLSASLSAGMDVNGQNILCLPCGGENGTDTGLGLPTATTTTTTRNDYDPDWRDTFHICLSFADGSPARTHAIQASLRPYKPTYFHFWQLKSFWHSLKISEEDIEILTHQDMETVPAMDVQELLLRSSTNKHRKSSSTLQQQNNMNDDPNYHARLVVEEMQRFKQDFLKSVSGNNAKTSEMKRFWLRKSQKPVLAVLLVEEQQAAASSIDGNSSNYQSQTTKTKLKLYRGTNMEVSMPTGSLCAERNVIGSALAANPGLRREDLKMVAVLAITLPADADGVHVPPQPRTQSQIQSQPEPDSGGASAASGSASIPSELRRSLSYASFVSIAEDQDEQSNANAGNDDLLLYESENHQNQDIQESIQDQRKLGRSWRHSRSFSEEEKAITANLLLQPSGKFNPIFDNINMTTNSNTMTSPEIPTLDLDLGALNLNLGTNNSPPSDYEYEEYDVHLNDTDAAATTTIYVESQSQPPQVVKQRTVVKHINILSHSDAESDVDESEEHHHSSSSFIKNNDETLLSVVGAPHQDQRQRSSSTSSAYSLYSKNKKKKKPVMGEKRMTQKKVVTLISSSNSSSTAPPDLNPLKPCGACNEWLKKIAEPNPNFKVLTFTDADCHGVYVTPVLD
jgi:cytidine deaminase